MKANLGQIDKALRIIIALGLILLLVTTIVPLFFAILASLVSIYLPLTSAFGSCLIYGLFGVNTKKNLNDKAYTYYRNQKHEYQK